MRKTLNQELNRLSIEEFRQSKKAPAVIVLDNIRSLQNIGSIFRTADAFRIEAIHLCGITASPPHRDIHRSALGATDSVCWKYFSDISHSLDELKSAGYIIMGLEQTNKSCQLQSFNLQGLDKAAIVLGNEIDGLSEKILDMLDYSLEIPQFGTKHSLNVAVSAGIVLWHLYLSTGLFKVLLDKPLL